MAIVSSVAVAGAVAGLAAAFGPERVRAYVTQTVPRALARPVRSVLTAAQALGSFAASFFRRSAAPAPLQGTLRSPGSAGRFWRAR